MLLEASVTQCRSQDAADWVPLNVLQDPRNQLCSFTFYLKCHVMIAMITNIYCVQHYAKCFPHIISLNKNTPSCPPKNFKKGFMPKNTKHFASHRHPPPLWMPSEKIKAPSDQPTDAVNPWLTRLIRREAQYCSCTVLLRACILGPVYVVEG